MKKTTATGILRRVCSILLVAVMLFTAVSIDTMESYADEEGDPVVNEGNGDEGGKGSGGIDGYGEGSEEATGNDLTIIVTHGPEKTPVEGAKVYLTNSTQDSGAHGSFRFEELTDAEGKVSIENFLSLRNQGGESGPLIATLTISKEGCRTFTTDITLDENSAIENPMSISIEFDSDPLSRDLPLAFKKDGETVTSDTVTYSEGLTYILNAKSPYEDDDASVSYTIESQIRDGSEVTDIASFATDDPAKLIITSSGTVTVKATATGGTKYTEGGSASFTLTIDKAEQSEFRFTENRIDLIIGQITTLQVQGAKTNQPVAFSGDFDNQTKVQKTDDPEYPGQPLSILAVEAGGCTLKAVIDGDDRYLPAEAECYILVSQQNLGGDHYELLGEHLIPDGQTTPSEWFSSPVTIKAVPENEYKISTENSIFADFQDSLTASTEGTHNYTLYTRKYVKIGSKWRPDIFSSASTEVATFFIDLNDPADLSVSYPEPVTKETENGVYYYNQAAQVTLSASDTAMGSGIDHFVYTLPGSSEAVTVPKENLTFSEPADGKITASAVVTVPVGVDGQISFTAHDAAGRSSAEYTDPTRIVIEDTKPQITVSYTDDGTWNGNSTDRQRTMKISVTEEHFDPEKVVFTMTAKDRDGNELPDSGFDASSLTWTEEEGDLHTAEITIPDEASYEITALQVTDLCGNASDEADYGESVSPTAFIIDKTAPTVKIEIGEQTWDKLIENPLWKLISKEMISIKIKTNDNLSGIRELYYLRAADEMTEEELRSEDTVWTEIDKDHLSEYSFNISQDAEFILYVIAIDQAGNSTLISSDGVTVDFTEPAFKDDRDAPMIEVTTSDPGHGIYNGDVKVSVKVTDPEVNNAYSGISSVDYQVIDRTGGENKVTQEGNLYEFSPESYIRHEAGQSFEKANAVTVSASKNNSNNIAVVLTAKDRAGNEETFELPLKIDTVKPVIEVSYDNNEVFNGRYFHAGRTATIRVTERNFDAGLVPVSVNGQQVNLSWTETAGTGNPDDTVHTAAVSFSAEGEYSFDVSGADLAGNDADSVNYGSAACPKRFFIDLKDPKDLQISYPSPVSTEKDGDSTIYYYDGEAVLSLTVSETAAGSGIHHLNVKLPGKNAVTIPASQLKALENADGTVTVTAGISDGTPADSLTVPEGTKGVVKVTAVDASGREISSDEKIVVVTDTTAPVVRVKYDNNSVKNGKWFAAGRKMTVTITEQYFHPEDVMLTVSKKAHEEDSWAASKIDLSKSFRKTKEQYTWEAEIDFSEDGYYQIELSYADPAKNAAKEIAYAAGTAAKTEFVVDQTAPKIHVTIDNNQVQNGRYFSAERTFTIVIDEVNFRADAVVLDAQEKKFTDASYQAMNVKPVFTRNGDQYTASITFKEDAAYTFAIAYADDAGNKNEVPVYSAGTMSQSAFVIDRTAPKVSVSYDNNKARNSTAFDADRTMTITVTDENFHAPFFSFSVTATDQAGNAVETEDFASVLHDAASWTSDGAVHTARLVFSKEAKYTLALSLQDLAANQNAGVDTGVSVAPYAFTIDKTNPTGSIAVGDFRASKDGRVWNQLLTGFTYSLFVNHFVPVVIESADELSGIEKLEYIITDEKLTLQALSARTDWAEASAGSFTLPLNSDRHLIVYAHLTDMAGNTLYFSSDGVTIDTAAPVVEKAAPVVTVTPDQPVNGIYSTDALVSVTVEDPVVGGVFSGLQRVEYQVFNRSISAETPTASGVLYSFGKEYPEKQEALRVYNEAAAVTVNSRDNNSNDVLVRVTAVDMAGNTASGECTLKMDVTAPTIHVSYNNNSALQERYFREQRTATITVNERNFDPSRVQISASATNGANASVSGWTKTEGSGNGDNTVWTATVSYSEDGDYSFSISLSDEAGNASEQTVFQTGTVAAEKFILDLTKAAISVSYDNNSAENESYYKDPRLATITITEQNFNAENVRVTITGRDQGRVISVPQVSEWKSNGTTHTATVLYDRDGDYDFAVNFTDLAGNVSDPYGQVSFTIDRTAPKLTISGVRNSSANSGDVIPVIT